MIEDTFNHDSTQNIPAFAVCKTILEQFTLLTKLKETSVLATYYGIDNESNTKVIIKTLRRKAIPPSLELRLIEEANHIQKLKHFLPEAPLQVGTDTEWLYAVLPFVEGQSLRKKLGGGSIEWTFVLDIGIRLLESLCNAHDNGIIHGDIKPENIILNESADKNSVTLIDFGLSWREDIGLSPTESLIGTLNYLSPEQGGLTQNRVDQRSDLYSVGVVMYECLTGKALFESNTIGELLRHHLTSLPGDIRSYQPSTPKSICSVILHLLEKEPKNRYQSAKAALEDLIYIQKNWQIQKSDPLFIPGFTDQRETLGLPSFIGRENELSALQQASLNSEKGLGGVCFVEAESGGGKTRLLSEFSQTLDRNRFTVMFGQGVDQSASLPFQMILGIAKDILNQVEWDPELKERIRSSLSAHQETLVSLFPLFIKFFPDVFVNPTGPELFGETRTLAALTRLLNCLGSKTKPAIIILDDAQWADELTLKLFHQWQQEPSDQKNHVLMVLAFRTEEVEPNHPLRKILPQNSLNLRPLDKTQTNLLTQSMAGRLPELVLDLIYRLSQGSPFMAAAVLRGLVETGMLLFEDGRWKHRYSSIEEVQSSHHAATVLIKRFKVLPHQLLNLLKIGAVLGKEFGLQILADLANLPVEAVEKLLLNAEERHILWSTGPNRYVFIHDKLRETLLDMTPAMERSVLHRSIAEKMERDTPENDFEISYHFDAAGDSERALPYALRSAQTARKRYSLQIAEIQFRIAERGIVKNDSLSLLEVNEALGDVLMLRGKYEEAETCLSNAKRIADKSVSIQPFQKANLNHKLGELHFKRGDLSGACESLEQALKDLGHSVPSHLLSFLVHSMWEISVQALHTLLPRLFTARKSPENQRDELLVLRIHSRMAYTYWFGKGRIPCLWTHLRGMNLAEKYTMTAELAQSYSEHAPVSTLLGLFKRGMLYVEKSLKIRRELKDLWGEGQSLNFYGTVLYADSQFQETIEKCRQSALILGRTGDLWEMNTAQWHVAYGYYRLGDLDRAIEISQHTYQAAFRIGDPHAAGICLSVWSKASGGRLPEEFLKDRLSHLDPNDIHTTSEILQAEGVRLLALQKVKEAEARFAEACEITNGSGMYTEYTVPAFAWLLTALRMQIQKTKTHEQKKRADLLKRAIKISRKALRLSQRFQNNLPHVLREKALLDAFLGRTLSAKKHFEESLRVSRKQHAAYETAKTLHFQGLLAKDLDWNIPFEQYGNAVKLLNELNANLTLEDESLKSFKDQSVSVSLLDRFESLLSVGRQIICSLSKEDLYQSIYNSFHSLLRAESCTLVKLEQTSDQNEVKILFGEHRLISLNLLKETEHEKKPVVFLGEQALKPSESMILSQVQSAMCVPIISEGKTVFFAYLTHHKIENLFGINEQRIAEFISEIAGATFDHQQGVESIRENAERLMRSNAELERYAYLASHDLQEPLRHLHLTSQMLFNELKKDLGKDINENITHHLHVISDASKRMREMVSDMLKYAKLDSVTGPFQEISLMDVVDRAKANLIQTIEETQTLIHCDPLPKVTGNAVQLVSLFQNLLSNSIKFSSSRRPEIHIHCMKEGRNWRFQISDNGIGFDPKYNETIFEPFRRLQSASLYPGTGIGLAACRKIITQHSGQIWADSASGQGTKLYFTLPRNE